jgi:RHS repeat-associated protein
LPEALPVDTRCASVHRDEEGQRGLLTFGARQIGELSVAHEVVVDPRSGAASLRVPIAVPAGRAGLQPNLALVCSSGGGTSPFGSGMSLSGLSSIAVDAERRVPRWDGSDDLLIDGEPLVAWRGADGAPRGFTDSEYTVAFLRRRVGSGDLRVEKWVERATGQVHFRARSADGVITIFGARPDGTTRIADPADGTRTLRWLPEVQLDSRGNVLWFEHLAETLDGVDLSAAAERRAPALAQRYLKSIRYGNVEPIALSDALIAGTLPSATRFCFHVVFDYGDHEQSRATRDRAWPVRPDVSSSFRGGFDVRTYRLCRRILVFHELAELGPRPVLVTSLVLSHDATPAGALLREVTQIGHRGDGESRSLPPLRLTYSTPATAASFEPVAAARENVPAGLSGAAYSFVDLRGDGLPGILHETPGGWTFKRNLGAGRFAAQVAVMERPAVRAGTYALGDVDGDGHADASLFSSRLAGLFEQDGASRRWTHRAFTTFPHLEAMTGRAQWVDLDGDGLPELVMAYADHLVWYPPDGKGYAGPVEVPLPKGARSLPAFVEDGALSLFFADMTGDGLPDLVRVQNGRVEYWPSLGNGRFGDGIVLDDAPQFASDGMFDPSRIRFVDLDGSGTADIAYVGTGEVATWTNAAGNRLVPGAVLGGLPIVDRLSTVRVLDLLGNGRPCLVWSTPLPGRSSSLEVLPLLPETRPRLLISVDDSRGRETRLAYSSSATHYLRDEESEQPWRTLLPFHVTVVDRRETIDHLRGTRTVDRYEYHDGAYDGERRDFLGFGLVDVFSVAVDEDDPASGSVTRNWFHLGGELGTLPEIYDADALLPLVAPHVIEDASRLTADELDDALRVVAGSAIRRETYAVGATGERARHPFHVEQIAYRIRRTQPAHGTSRAGFALLTDETYSAVYEQDPVDPRTAQTLLLAVDAHDQPTREVEISHARRAGRPRDVKAQDALRIVMSERTALAIDENHRFRLAIPLAARDLELAGPRGTRLTRADFETSELLAAMASPQPHHEPLRSGAAARLLSSTRFVYWDDARTSALPFGSVGHELLVHHEENACFADTLVARELAPRVDATRLRSLGYVLHDGLWWRQNVIHHYAPRERFSLQVGGEYWDGGRSAVEYDDYSLVVIAELDEVGNRTTGVVDYHVMELAQITEPNGLVSRVRYDPLGVVVATTTRGQVAGQRWGFGDDLAVPSVTPREALADPARVLGERARVAVYDLDAWHLRREPPVAVTIGSEELLHGANRAARIQLGVTYYDGLGEPLQEKLHVEPGPAIARDAAGNVIVDAGGRPVLRPTDTRWRVAAHEDQNSQRAAVRIYQPYFSPSPDYDDDRVLARMGVPTQVRYDAGGRELGRDLPNGTFTRITYTAWGTEIAGADDTVLDSSYRAMRERLPADHPERRALDSVRGNHGTTTYVFLDPSGSQVGQLERGGSAGDRRTERRTDGGGFHQELVDGRGLTVYSSMRDMTGRELRTHSADAGDAWALADALDRTVLTWDTVGTEVEYDYDRAGRVLAIRLREGPAAPRVVETRVYGESLADGLERNLLGRVAVVRDEAGQVTVERCNPAGQVLAVTRRFGDEDFTTESQYDALGRVVHVRRPDGTVEATTYAIGGATQRVTVTTPDGRLADVDVLADASYDPDDARATARLGNGVELTYSRHPDTRKLVRQRAERGGRIYQDLAYTWNAGDQLTMIDDAARIIRASAPARRDYEYDPFGRLVSATGRVHQALLEHDQIPGAAGTLKGTRHISLDNPAAIETFTRTYTYDLSNNLRTVHHAGTTQQWTTAMQISTRSNRSLPARDANGIALTDLEARFDAAGQPRGLDHLRRLAWTWRGQLARAVIVERAGGVDDDEAYVYDSDGLRIARTTTRLVTAGVIEVIEKVYIGTAQRTRIRRNGDVILERWTHSIEDDEGRLALLDRWVRDDRARETDDPARPRLRYVLATHQGSGAFELDEDGGVLSYEEYFPYGGTAFIAGRSMRDCELRELRYSGKERDDATGLYYYGQRYYAPWLYRWLTPDPAGTADGLNLYEFVQSDPIGNVDPDGLAAEPATGKPVYRTAIPPWAQGAYSGIPPPGAGQVQSFAILRFKDGSTRVVSAAYYNRLKDEVRSRGKVFVDERVVDLQRVQAPGGGDGGDGSADASPKPVRGRRRRAAAKRVDAPAQTPPVSSGGDELSRSGPEGAPRSANVQGSGAATQGESVGAGDEGEGAAEQTDDVQTPSARRTPPVGTGLGKGEGSASGAGKAPAAGRRAAVSSGELSPGGGTSESGAGIEGGVEGGTGKDPIVAVDTSVQTQSRDQHLDRSQTPTRLDPTDNIGLPAPPGLQFNGTNPNGQLMAQDDLRKPNGNPAARQTARDGAPQGQPTGAGRTGSGPPDLLTRATNLISYLNPFGNTNDASGRGAARGIMGAVGKYNFGVFGQIVSSALNIALVFGPGNIARGFGYAAQSVSGALRLKALFARIATDIASGALPKAGTVTAGEAVLRQWALLLREGLPWYRRFRSTTAVLVTEGGVFATVRGFGLKGLTQTQLRIAKELGIKGVPSLPGLHAEASLLLGAYGKPLALYATNYICPRCYFLLTGLANATVHVGTKFWKHGVSFPRNFATWGPNANFCRGWFATALKAGRVVQ